MSNKRRKEDNTRRMSTRKETIERHSQMKLVVRELKICANSAPKRYWFSRLFTEARWTYNWYLQQSNNGKKLSQIKDSDDIAIVLTPGGYETRRLIALSSQMRQEVRKQLGTNMKSLKSNIQNGNIKHGTLRYKQACNEVPLKVGKWTSDEATKNKACTFELNDKCSRVHLQGAPFLLKVLGGKQIPRKAEIADGKLVRRGGDYFLQVTFFIEHEKSADERENDFLSAVDALDGVGLDFGIETNITMSSGEKLNWCFEETERLKAAQKANEEYRAWHRRKFGYSRSSNKQVRVMNEEYDKIQRRKRDAVNKFIYLMRERGFVAVQDEQVRAWHADERYSDVIHHSIMGGIMARLKKEPSTLVVDRWVRTTGVCPDCGHVLVDKLGVSEREWACPACGVHHDRDGASAGVILLLGAVSLLYPDCPSGLDRGVWERLLAMLRLDVPVGCLNRVG